MNVKDILNYAIFKIIDGHLYMVTPDKTYYPNGIDPYQYPRYKAPITSITSSRVLTHTIDVDNLILGGVPVDTITYDADNNDIYTLVTAKALYDNVKVLSNRISDIDPHNVLYQDNTVVSLPITDTSFNSEFWDYSKWDVSRGSHATFTATGTLNDVLNYMTLKGHPFTRHGTYFINIEIENLDSGKLCVYDESNNLLRSTIVSGRFGVVYNPINPDSANITIKAEDVLANEFISISSVSIYFITLRLQEYLDYIVPFIVSGGSDYASTLYVDRALEAAKFYVDEAIDRLPDFSMISALQGHMVDRVTNPHGITCAMIHASEDTHTHDPRDLVPPAALADHSHLPIEIGAADRDHTHTPDEVGAAPRLHTHTAIELGVSPVDHTHTPDQCGAAPVVHTHEPEECGAAPAVHVHNLDDLGAAPADHTHLPEDIGAANVHHTHIPSECGAAPVDHTHSIAELDEEFLHHTHDPADLEPPAAYADHTHDLSDLGVAPIDHTHSLEDLGAAPVNHTHNPEDIGAAAIDHTHTLASLGAAAVDHTHTYKDVGAAPEEHTHSEYLVDEDMKDYQFSSQPKMCRVSGVYLPKMIHYIPDIKVPTALMTSSRMVHAYMDDVDPNIGYAYTNVRCDNNTYPWHAFYTATTIEDRTYISFNSAVSETAPIIIGYKFFNKNTLYSYTIERPNNTTNITAWKVVNNKNKVIDERTGIVWNSNELSKVFVLSEVKEITDLNIVITTASNPLNLHILLEFESRFSTIHKENESDEETTSEYTNELIYCGANNDVFIAPSKNNYSRIVVSNNTKILNFYDIIFSDYPYVYLYTSGGSVFNYTTIPLECGYTRQGIPLFDNFKNNGVYGKISYIDENITGSTPATDPIMIEYTSNILNFYNNYSNYEITNLMKFNFTSANTVTVMHESIPDLNLIGWTCFIDNESIRNGTAPTSLEIQYIRYEKYKTEEIPIEESESDAGPSSETQTVVIVPTDTTRDDYGNEILVILESSETDRVYSATLGEVKLDHQYFNITNYISDINHVVFDTPISGIKQIKYVFKNENGTGVSFAGMCPLFTGDFYNINENVLYDENNEEIINRIYLGVCKTYKRYDNVTLLYPFATPINNEIDIPLDIRPEEYTEIEIPNVFFTRYIDITPIDTAVQEYTYTENNSTVTCHCLPSVKIKDVTPEKISMIVHGTRAIKIHRLW